MIVTSQVEIFELIITLIQFSVAQFFTELNITVAIPGILVPSTSQNVLPQFRANSLSAALPPAGETRGKMVPDGQLGTLTPNVANPPFYNWNVDPPGSYMAIFTYDLDAKVKILGLFMPSQTQGLPDKFRAKDPKLIKDIESHGTIVPDNQPGSSPITGYMGPPILGANEDAIFVRLDLIGNKYPKIKLFYHINRFRIVRLR